MRPAPDYTTTSTLTTDILAFLQEVDRFDGVAQDLQTQLTKADSPLGGLQPQQEAAPAEPAVLRTA